LNFVIDDIFVTLRGLSYGVNFEVGKMNVVHRKRKTR